MNPFSFEIGHPVRMIESFRRQLVADGTVKPDAITKGIVVNRSFDGNDAQYTVKVGGSAGSINVMMVSQDLIEYDTDHEKPKAENVRPKNRDRRRVDRNSVEYTAGALWALSHLREILTSQSVLLDDETLKQINEAHDETHAAYEKAVYLENLSSNIFGELLTAVVGNVNPELKMLIEKISKELRR